MSSVTTADPIIVIVPGLRDHVPEHWQTLLAATLPCVRMVPPMGRADLSLARRVEAIEAAVASVGGPVLIVAHSGGIIAAVHWARRTKSTNVAAALLAAPPDFETPMPAGYPAMAELQDGGWLPVPRSPLPFASIVAVSRNDPLCGFERAAEMARGWGSRVVDLGEVGHLNPASGFGPWPQAESLIEQLARS